MPVFSPAVTGWGFFINRLIFNVLAFGKKIFYVFVKKNLQKVLTIVFNPLPLHHLINHSNFIEMFFIIFHDTVKGAQIACMADHYEVWADGYLASYENQSKLLPSDRYQFKKVVAKTDLPTTRTFYPFEL